MLSWVELREFIRHSPPGSELTQTYTPMGRFKTPDIMLMMTIIDALHGANWQRGGGKGARPVPVYQQIEKQIQHSMKPVANMTTEKMSEIRRVLRERRRKH